MEACAAASELPPPDSVWAFEAVLSNRVTGKWYFVFVFRYHVVSWLGSAEFWLLLHLAHRGERIKITHAKKKGKSQIGKAAGKEKPPGKYWLQQSWFYFFFAAAILMVGCFCGWGKLTVGEFFCCEYFFVLISCMIQFCEDEVEAKKSINLQT